MTTLTQETSAKNVDKLVNAAMKAIGGYQQSVQTAAVAIIEHANSFGDCSKAKVLARAVPARERNMLIGYFALYSPIGVQIGKTVADDKCRFIRAESKRYNDFNIDGAKANNWFDDPAKAQPEPKPLNTLGSFYDSLDNMLKRWIAMAEAEPEKSKIEADEKAAVLKNAKEIRKTVTAMRSKNVTTAEAA